MLQPSRILNFMPIYRSEHLQLFKLSTKKSVSNLHRNAVLRQAQRGYFMDSDKNNELNQYGVWVKTPPRTAENEINESKDIPEEEETREELPDFSFLDNIAAADQVANGESDDNSPEKTLDEDFNFDTITQGDIPLDEFISEPEDTNTDLPPQLNEANTENEAESTSEGSEEIIEDKVEVEEKSEENNSMIDLPDIPDGDVSLDEFMSDDSNSRQEESEETTDSFESQIQSDSEISDISDISIDDFMSGDSSTISSDSEKTEQKVEADEVSLSDFLGDSSSDAGNDDNFIPDGEVSLDAFFDTNENEKERAASQEEENFDEPLDIDLTFDDNLQVETEEDSSLDDLIDFTDEPSTDFSTAGSAGDESVDLSDFLDDTSSADSQEQEKVSADNSAENTESIDLSEFGIEEDSSPDVAEKAGSAAQVKTQDYNLSVTTDDEDNSTEESDESENSNTDDDLSLNLDANEEKVEQEEKKESNFSDPSDEFDVDSLLNSIEDENGNTVKIEETAQEIVEDSPTEEITEVSTDEVSVDEVSEETSVEESPIEEKTLEEPTVEAHPIEEETSKETTVEESPVEEKTTDFTEQDENTGNESPSFSMPSFEMPDFSSTDVFSDTEESQVTEEPLIEDSGTEEAEKTAINEIFDKKDEEIFNNDIDESSNSVENSSISLPEAGVATALAEGMIEEQNTELDGEENMDDTKSFADGSNEVLNRIVEDLKELKNEINSLRADFEDFKRSGSNPVAEPEVSAETDITQEQEEEPTVGQVESGGSFGDDDGDVALSGDELSNILSNAEMNVEEAEQIEAEDDVRENIQTESDILGSVENTPEVPQETYAQEENGLSVDFNNETLEEPNLDSIDLNNESAETQVQEEEISVPKVDDILVESSSSDFIDSAIADESATSEPVPEESTLVEEVSTDEVEVADAGDSEKIETEDVSVESFDSEPIIEDTEEPLVEETVSEEVSEETTVASEESASEEVSEETEAVAETEEKSQTSRMDEILNTIHQENIEKDLAGKEVHNATIDETSPLNEPLAPEISGNPAEEEKREGIVASVDEIIETPEGYEEEPLTEDNIEFLKEEASIDEIPQPTYTESDEEEEENLEPGISEEPTGKVFNQWETSIDTEPAVSEDEVIESDTTEAEVDTVSESEVEKAESSSASSIPEDMKEEIKAVLSYMDQLLENLPEEKIEEFAKSEQFVTYKKLFKELGLS